MFKFRNQTAIISPGSPTNKNSPPILPTTFTQEVSNPAEIKRFNLNDMRKQIVKLNPDKSELGAFHEFILERHQPINKELAQAYDEI